MKDRCRQQKEKEESNVLIIATMLDKLLLNIIPVTILFNCCIASYEERPKPVVTIKYKEKGSSEPLTPFRPTPNAQYVENSIEGSTRNFQLFYAPNWCNKLSKKVAQKIPKMGWIAVIPAGNKNCTCRQKLLTAKNYNASAAIILLHKEYSDCDDSHIRLEITAVTISDMAGKLLKLVTDYLQPSNPLGTIFCQITKPKKPHDKQFRVSKTSVLFVLVSFILLMCISLAWLVFYYVQRFRHIYRNDRKEKQLLSAAKKAISKLKTISFNSANIDGEDDSCAVCLENYKDGENIRILPCKHLFHKSCIDPWLLNHRTCPMCKSNILKSLGVEIPDNIDLSQYDIESRRISHDVEIVQSSPAPAPAPDDDDDEEQVVELPNECAIPSTSVFTPGASSSQAWSEEPNVASASVCSSTSSMLSDTDSERSTVALVSVVQKV